MERLQSHLGQAMTSGGRRQGSVAGRQEKKSSWWCNSSMASRTDRADGSTSNFSSKASSKPSRSAASVLEKGTVCVSMVKVH